MDVYSKETFELIQSERDTARKRHILTAIEMELKRIIPTTTIPDRIIDSVKENGFDEAVSLVPVGKDGVLLDGSHRCAACAYFNKNIKVIYFDFLERNFNFTFFLERGLKHCY